MKLYWNCPRIALKLYWKWTETALKMNWSSTGICLELPWNCPETALKLPWNCPGGKSSRSSAKNCPKTALKMHWPSCKINSDIEFHPFSWLSWRMLPQLDRNGANQSTRNEFPISYELWAESIDQAETIRQRCSFHLPNLVANKFNFSLNNKWLPSFEM